MSEFTSEGSQAADEEVEYVESEPNDDPLSQPGEAAESSETSGPAEGSGEVAGQQED